jgi:hypothetical protein
VGAMQGVEEVSGWPGCMPPLSGRSLSEGTPLLDAGELPHAADVVPLLLPAAPWLQHAKQWQPNSRKHW